MSRQSIIAAIAAIGDALHRARLRRYRAIAARTGLSVKSGIVNPLQVYGMYAGRQITMSTTSPRSAAFFRKTWTRVFVEVRNPRDVALHLRRKDAIDRLRQAGIARPDSSTTVNAFFVARSR